MTLKAEITALRAEIDKFEQARKSDEALEAPAPAEEAPPEGEHRSEKLVDALRLTADEVGAFVDRYPRLSALGALTAGLSFSLLLARRRR